ncbi:hypothetical protein K5I29_09020 [Flavobacterium agricola]|uniref:CarboxypepD_reg-like domain-containing protein n=1 Tax=Flavobacterium agricola TaxID=2870839 RepID=A0ABY6LWT6_9FLAO|nr:hypothetical protein [Flavobacterium agricola]UYW00674.1 hypothetical protein K5I29_09020 [Flavobacterium agricola]
MKTKISILLLCLSAFAFAQNIVQQKPIYGQLLSDSLNVKNVTVLNRTSKLETKTSADGTFTIKANPKDTLYFDSPNIITMQYVVDPVDFNVELQVNVYPKSTLLDEIVIYRHNLTGQLGLDGRSLPTFYRDLEGEIREKVTGLDLDSEQQNSRVLVDRLHEGMPGTIKSDPYAVNFVAISNAVGKLFKKSQKPSERQKIQEQVYVVYGKNNLADQLNMSTTEVNYYLDYLIANNKLDKHSTQKLDALSLLEVLVSNRSGYYAYLQEEIK